MKFLTTAAKAATLSFAIGVAFMPAASIALPQWDRVVTYRDEAGQMVGGHIMNCMGKSSSWGQQTSNFDVVATLCSESTGDPCAGWNGAPQGYACPWAGEPYPGYPGTGQ